MTGLWGIGPERVVQICWAVHSRWKDGLCRSFVHAQPIRSVI